MYLTGVPKNAGTANADIVDENTRRNVDNNAGRTIGIVTFLIIVNLEACKSDAASSKFASMFLNIPPIKMYANGA